MHTGSCLCGRVAFRIDGDLPLPVACHCGQCCKRSGHYWASTPVPDARFQLTREDGLRWFEASDTAKRGFCSTCGAFLFWKAHDGAQISIAMGAIEAPTGMALRGHIFIADKGDYYDIADGLPQQAQ